MGKRFPGMSTHLKLGLDESVVRRRTTGRMWASLDIFGSGLFLNKAGLKRPRAENGRGRPSIMGVKTYGDRGLLSSKKQLISTLESTVNWGKVYFANHLGAKNEIGRNRKNQTDRGTRLSIWKSGNERQSGRNGRARNYGSFKKNTLIRLKREKSTRILFSKEYIVTPSNRGVPSGLACRRNRVQTNGI